MLSSTFPTKQKGRQILTGFARSGTFSALVIILGCGTAGCQGIDPPQKHDLEDLAVKRREEYGELHSLECY
jgi:hypothetical protein